MSDFENVQGRGRYGESLPKGEVESRWIEDHKESGMIKPAFKWPESSGWKCYLFGSKPGCASGFTWEPAVGEVPNAFVRFFMRVCLGCTWVENDEHENGAVGGSDG